MPGKVKLLLEILIALEEPLHHGARRTGLAREDERIPERDAQVLPPGPLELHVKQIVERVLAHPAHDQARDRSGDAKR